jgi:fructosamine-3-kinase
VNKIFTILFVITKALGNNKNEKTRKMKVKETTHVFCLSQGDNTHFILFKQRKTLSCHKALLFSLTGIQFP